MEISPRVVLDTNVLVSALLSSTSPPAQAVRAAVDKCILLASRATLSEIEEVLRKRKLSKWLSVEARAEFLSNYRHSVQEVPILTHLRICRDAKDDKFLELAVDGAAHAIVTGDDDLLSLDPFQGIRILTPQQYLALGGPGGAEAIFRPQPL